MVVATIRCAEPSYISAGGIQVKTGSRGTGSFHIPIRKIGRLHQGEAHPVRLADLQRVSRRGCVDTHKTMHAHLTGRNIIDENNTPVLTRTDSCIFCAAKVKGTVVLAAKK